MRNKGSSWKGWIIMKVKYWWTEDGSPEMCERADCVLKESTECYHCNVKLSKGAMVAALTSVEDGDKYFMCMACAYKSIQVL